MTVGDEVSLRILNFQFVPVQSALLQRGPAWRRALLAVSLPEREMRQYRRTRDPSRCELRGKKAGSESYPQHISWLLVEGRASRA